MKQTTLCYILKDDCYLLLLRDKKEEDANAGKMIGVGGKCEEGETPDQCICREVSEETGLTLVSPTYRGIVYFRSDTAEDEDMFLYTAADTTGTLKDVCDEGSFVMVPKDELLSINTWEGDYEFLKDLAEDDKPICLTLKYHGERLTEVLRQELQTPIVRSDLLSAKHAFSTRLGGVSEGIYSSLNLGFHRGDTEENVIENWRRFGICAGICTERIAVSKQIHENRVRIIRAKDTVALTDFHYTTEADGMVTKEPGVPLVVFTADCVPLLMHDPVAGVIAAVHCGWRGVALDIMQTAVDAMISLGSDPADIRAVTGPAIGKEVFEVGIDVAMSMQVLIGDASADYITPLGDLSSQDAQKIDEAKYLVDLKGIVLYHLQQLGLTPDHLDNVGGCTYAQPEMYFSHRYTNGQRGSQASMIML